MKLPFIAVAALMAPACLPAQQSPAPLRPDTKAEIRTSAQEVLLDIVVRDKKGRPVKDLEPNEIEITDAGVVQKPKSFRLVTGNEPAGKNVPREPAPGVTLR